MQLIERVKERKKEKRKIERKMKENVPSIPSEERGMHARRKKVGGAEGRRKERQKEKK